MIKIKNVSVHYGEGRQIYHLYVSPLNDKSAINLTYACNYEDGLAGCLKAAYEMIKMVGV